MTSRRSTYRSDRRPSVEQAALPSPYSGAVSTHRTNSLAGIKHRSSSSLLTTPSTTRSEQICALISRALQQSQSPSPYTRSHYPPLNALVLDVQDVSCAQLQYRLLGTKRYWYRFVKQEKQGTKRWEVKLFEVRCRKSVLESVAALHWGRVERLTSADAYVRHIGFFDSERAAMAASDAAVHARDVTNPFTGVHVSRTPLPDALIKVFAVHVVSEAFQRLSQRERLRIVYEILFDALEAAAAVTVADVDASGHLFNPSADLLSAETAAAVLGIVSPALWTVQGADLRGFSGCVGTHVAALPLWRALTLHLRVLAMTPAQWRASGSSSKAAALLGDTDRFGASHLANDRALAVDSALLPASRELAALVCANQEDIAARTQSVLPHFYHGLPDELKRMIAEEQARAGGGSGQLHQKLLQNTEVTFVKKYAKRRREYAFAAVKLQRSLRMRSQCRVLRELFLRQRGALALQRLVRGHCARKFARAYWQVVTCAALLIQSVYRAHVSRELTRALRARMHAAARDIQRVLRGHCARKYVQWMRRLESSAIAVERVARGFMARQRVKRIRAARHKARVVMPASMLIQRVWRGHCARCVVAEKRALRRKLEVLHPAAVCIERLLRGYLARRLAARFRTANRAARVLQRFWRELRYRKKWFDLMALRRRDRMASRIGALGRGYVARKFYRREQRKRYLRCVLQPAAVHIQRVFRGHVVRKQLEELRDCTEAAITLQQMWRKRSRIKTIASRLHDFRVALRHAKAAQIQRCYRCHRARQQLLYLQLSYRARYGKAAVAIQSAWRSHCARVQLREFRFCARVERKACALTQSKDAREMLAFDLLDARNDLKRVVKYKAKALQRIKELKAMRIEWERRQPFVAQELANLTSEDLDRGWGEAFETEQHILHYSLELSVEDILARKQQVREYDAEVDDLRLEIEDLERDLEECVLNETVELEAYRDMELAHARTMFASDRERKVRVQRIRWRIKSDRKRVVLRERRDIEQLMQVQLAKRQIADLGVLSFERKQLLQLRMQQAIEKAATASSRQALQLVEQRRDAEIMRGLDGGIARMQVIVDEHSFDYRVPKVDVRERAAESLVASPMCAACGRITCDCDSYVPPSATKRRNAAIGTADALVLGEKLELSDSPTKTKTTQLTRSRLARRPKYQD